MKITRILLAVIGIFLTIHTGYAWDLADLAKRKDLWPKEVIMVSTASYENPPIQLKGGTKIPLVAVTPKALVLEFQGERYSLSMGFTHLPFLFEDGDFVTNPTALVPAQAPVDLDALSKSGPDFGFLLDIGTEWSPELKTRALELLQNQEGWQKLGVQMGTALFKSYENNEVGRPGWNDRLGFSRACSDLGAEESTWKGTRTAFGNKKEQPLFHRFNLKTLSALLQNSPLLYKLSLYQLPQDHPIGIWSVLTDLQEAFPEDVLEYPALATAFAIVYDIDLPREWPHRQVPQDLVPRLKDKPWIPLFRYFVQADREGRLLTKLKDLSVADLKFLVDAPIEISEFEWARKNIKQKRNNFDQTYSDVIYDDPRIDVTPPQYIWPHINTPYTLAYIKTKHGICIDQAYFASIAAKAFGIPSIKVSGMGSTCAHAWFGYMPGNDRWNMKGGRYAANNYVVGEAYNPQTWETINDHELDYISQRFSESPEYEKSQLLLALEFLNSRTLTPENRQKLLHDAKTECLKNPEAWFRLESFYETSGNVEELKTFYPAMAEQFSSQKDWKARAQTRMATLAEKSGESDSAEALKSKIQSENKGKRADLALDIVSREAIRQLLHGKTEKALTSYKTAVRRYGKEMGLTLMTDFVAPFFHIALAMEQWDAAEETLKTAQSLVVEGYFAASLNQSKTHLEKLKKELDEIKKGSPAS